MTREELIHELKIVPWNIIRQSAERTCEHIPDAIMGLLSPDAEVRDNASRKLDNHVVVQSDLYEGALYVIPFLLQLLRIDTHIEKHGVYDMLYEIGNGGALYNDNIRYRRVMGACSYYLPDKDGINLPLKIACRSAVLEGFYLFLEEVRSNRSHCREKALELIGSFYEHARYLVKPALGDILNTVLEESARNQINEAIKDIEEWESLFL